MHWLQSLDVGLFRFVNQTLSNPFFDWLMPILSGTKQVFPWVLAAMIVIAVWLLWKDRPRAAVCLLMLALIIWPGDSYISNTIKHGVARPRPFVTLEGVNRLVKTGKNSSMPSSHAANWGAGTMILFIYYRRRSLIFMLPLAILVSFSRVYNGVHYPSDVLAGAILGAGYAAAGVWAVNALWQWAGRHWFPAQWKKFPSLLQPQFNSTT